MSVPESHTHRLGPASCALGLVLALTSCGGTGDASVAADSVVAADPGLRERLATVDADIADGRYADAATDLRSLVTDVRAARTAGRIDQARSDAALRAAADLSRGLRAPSGSQSPTSPLGSPTLTPTPSPSPGVGDDESGDDDPHGPGANPGDGHGKDHENGHGKGHGKAHGKRHED